MHNVVIVLVIVLTTGPLRQAFENAKESWMEKERWEVKI